MYKETKIEERNFYRHFIPFFLVQDIEGATLTQQFILPYSQATINTTLKGVEMPFLFNGFFIFKFLIYFSFMCFNPRE